MKPVRKSQSGSALLERVPPLWKKRFRVIGRAAARRPWPLCLVGGCVRDLLLRRPALDWDVVSEGPVGLLAKEASKLLSARLVQHPAFLTYTLLFPDGSSLDLATARKEIYTQPAALPVVEPARLEDDFSRRDFTVNALALHLTPRLWGRLEDPFSGKEDIKKGLVRILHEKSFQDDPTRLFRAARYAGRFGWRVEDRTRGLILECVRSGLPEKLTPARLRHELEKILLEENPAPGLRLLREWGAWTFWRMNGWNASVENALAKPAPAAAEVRLAARLMILFRSRPVSEAEESLRRLEFPRATAESVVQSLKLLTLLEEGRMDPTQTVRLSPAAQFFLKNSLNDGAALRRFSRSEPLLGGEDLRKLGYPPGPLYQEIFRSLRDARWKGAIRTRPDEIRHVLRTFPIEKTP
jgi:tRNA nucleotidyltransferase (CCA-adding enzyme)